MSFAVESAANIWIFGVFGSWNLLHVTINTLHTRFDTKSPQIRPALFIGQFIFHNKVKIAFSKISYEEKNRDLICWYILQFLFFERFRGILSSSILEVQTTVVGHICRQFIGNTIFRNVHAKYIFNRSNGCDSNNYTIFNDIGRSAGRFKRSTLFHFNVPAIRFKYITRVTLSSWLKAIKFITINNQ